MKLSKNFHRGEFECFCGQCGKDTVDSELIDVLQDLRNHFVEPVGINSGNRCSAYNKKINGSLHSQHLLSKAADIIVRFISPELVADYLEDKYPDKYGIGRYKKGKFTHIDVRATKTRWTDTT